MTMIIRLLIAAVTATIGFQYTHANEYESLLPEGKVIHITELSGETVVALRFPLSTPMSEEDCTFVQEGRFDPVRFDVNNPNPSGKPFQGSGFLFRSLAECTNDRTAMQFTGLPNKEIKKYVKQAMDYGFTAKVKIYPLQAPTTILQVTFPKTE